MRAVSFDLTDFLVLAGVVLFAYIRHLGMDAVGIDALILFFWYQTRSTQRP